MGLLYRARHYSIGREAEDRGQNIPQGDLWLWLDIVQIVVKTPCSRRDQFDVAVTGRILAIVLVHLHENGGSAPSVSRRIGGIGIGRIKYTIIQGVIIRSPTHHKVALLGRGQEIGHGGHEKISRVTNRLVHLLHGLLLWLSWFGDETLFRAQIQGQGTGT